MGEHGRGIKCLPAGGARGARIRSDYGLMVGRAGFRDFGLSGQACGPNGAQLGGNDDCWSLGSGRGCAGAGAGRSEAGARASFRAALSTVLAQEEGEVGRWSC